MEKSQQTNSEATVAAVGRIGDCMRDLPANDEQVKMSLWRIMSAN